MKSSWESIRCRGNKSTFFHCMRSLLRNTSRDIAVGKLRLLPLLLLRQSRSGLPKPIHFQCSQFVLNGELARGEKRERAKRKRKTWKNPAADYNKNRPSSTTCGEELKMIFKDWQSQKDFANTKNFFSSGFLEFDDLPKFLLRLLAKRSSRGHKKILPPSPPPPTTTTITRTINGPVGFGKGKITHGNFTALDKSLFFYKKPWN